MSFQPAFVLSSASSSDQLMNNYMNALTGNVPERSSAPAFTWSSPISHPLTASFDGDLLLGEEDLMLPDAAYASGTSSPSPKFADATVVTSTSTETGFDVAPPTIITTSKPNRKSSNSSERRHSLPSTVMMSDSKIGNALTQPVPEFLCHLFTMLRDPNLSEVISWEVPTQDESDCMGGGFQGIGKIVCHQPESLQDFVLDKYYRHSKYASFQRQLNYFGFKKRLHGGKKGKLSPCSYVHEGLDGNVESLLTLKRRPPVKKRASIDISMNDSSSDSVSSMEEVVERPKKRRNSVIKSKSKKDGDKKPPAKVQFPSEHIPVKAEEYAAPSFTGSMSLSATTPFAVSSNPQFLPAAAASRPTSAKPNPAPASATLAQLLSTALPPTEVLFGDDFSVDLNTGETIESSNPSGFYVNDQGRCLSQNSLVNLAMFY